MTGTINPLVEKDLQTSCLQSKNKQIISMISSIALCCIVFVGVFLATHIRFIDKAISSVSIKLGVQILCTRLILAFTSFLFSLGIVLIIFLALCRRSKNLSNMAVRERDNRIFGDEEESFELNKRNSVTEINDALVEKFEDLSGVSEERNIICLNNLCYDLLIEILEYLSVRQAYRMRLVSKTFEYILGEQKELVKRHFPGVSVEEFSFETDSNWYLPFIVQDVERDFLSNNRNPLTIRSLNFNGCCRHRTLSILSEKVESVVERIRMCSSLKKISFCNSRFSCLILFGQVLSRTSLMRASKDLYFPNALDLSNIERLNYTFTTLEMLDRLLDRCEKIKVLSINFSNIVYGFNAIEKSLDINFIRNINSKDLIDAIIHVYYDKPSILHIKLHIKPIIVPNHIIISTDHDHLMNFEEQIFLNSLQEEDFTVGVKEPNVENRKKVKYPGMRVMNLIISRDTEGYRTRNLNITVYFPKPKKDLT